MSNRLLETAARARRPGRGAAALALLLSLAALPARASFDDVPLSPRNAALVDSNAGDVYDGSGVLLNPAAAGGIRRWELYANEDKLYTGLSDGSNIARQVISFGAPFKWGTLVAGINDFTGGTIYSESDEYFGFGKPAFHNKFWFGGTLHMLGLKYTTDQYSASNPILSKGSSKSAMGMDIGMIYFAKSFNFGLSILDANQPDLGIAAPDPVDRKIHLSGSFHPMSALSLDTSLSEIGTATRLGFGGEIHRPRSNFFFRAGADIGAQDYRTLAFGLGYRTKNYQFDYAMSLPLSGVQTTLGNQQFSFIARWGRVKRKLPDRYAEDEDLDENGEEKPLPKVEAKTAAATAEDEEKAKEALDDARRDLLAGRFREGLEKLKESNSALISPEDMEELKAIGEKAEAVADIYASINVVNDRTRLVHDAITAYMQGDGPRAVNTVTYAWQLYPDDQNIIRLRALIMRSFPIDAFELHLLPGVKLTDQKLQEALESIYDGKYIQAVSTCKEILDLDPGNILAMIRMGSAYWAMGMQDQAREIWTKAQAKDPNNEILRKFLSRQPSERPEAGGRAASPEVQEEFKSKVAYYERLQRSGADPQTLASILKKIIDQFEGTGVDLSQVYKDYESVKGQSQ
ncbi:MAG TPA: tetratricopeptide repeat protein [Elusimicrobiota bacterium]|jgi:tetratricopeptide (TPR) repeat protein|nr:tetratricopeptide repeat protein [Elusimicrobiota bacterium]